jgi:hypothetical protein
VIVPACAKPVECCGLQRALAGFCSLFLMACGSQARHPPAPSPAGPIASAGPQPLAVDAGTPPGKKTDEPHADLPWAANTLDLVEATTVSVVGRDILVDESRVDTVLDEIVEQRRLRRLDALFQTLKERREWWKQAHPGEAFHGVVLFRFHPRELAAVVKSVFQTAAFAGYPNASFVVNRLGGSGQGRLNADTRVPLPPNLQKPELPEEARLHLDLITVDKCQLVWKHGNTVTDTRFDRPWFTRRTTSNFSSSSRRSTPCTGPSGRSPGSKGRPSRCPASTSRSR